jgi:hypothetical protein
LLSTLTFIDVSTPISIALPAFGIEFKIVEGFHVLFTLSQVSTCPSCAEPEEIWLRLIIF